jgi:hypothetical protein
MRMSHRLACSVIPGRSVSLAGLFGRNLQTLTNASKLEWNKPTYDSHLPIIAGDPAIARIVKPWNQGVGRSMSPSQVSPARIPSAPTWAVAKKTYFTGESAQRIGYLGTCITDGGKLYIRGAVLSGNDTTTDPRVTGESIFGLDAIWDRVRYTGQMWGSLRIANSEGEWNGYWQGTNGSSDQNIITSVVATAVGSGAYKGLLARWTYSGIDVDQTHKISISGFIVEAKACILPLQVSATRTERITLHPGLIVTPPAKPPYSEATVATVDIVEEVAQISYIGRTRNAGTGLILPHTGDFSGTGTAITEDGDLIHWVVVGKVGFGMGKFEAAVKVYVAGGTARFEAAVGEISTAISAKIDYSEDPSVFTVTFSYPANGIVKCL